MSPSKYNNPYTSVSDERGLTGKGFYDMQNVDIEDHLNEINAAKPDKENLNEVLDNYTRILSG